MQRASSLALTLNIHVLIHRTKGALSLEQDYALDDRRVSAFSCDCSVRKIVNLSYIAYSLNLSSTNAELLLQESAPEKITLPDRPDT